MEIKEVLEQIAKPARSNKNGFYDLSKLEAIEQLLQAQQSPFTCIQKTNYTWMFGKREPIEGENVVLVSTHADIVTSIVNPFSELDEETGYFKGTYDNLSTNAMCTSLMINQDLPENVFFAFNAEEETGRCLGAADALSYIKATTKKEPIVLALDVTDEGYENDRLFTVEGLHGANEFSRRKMIEILLSTEGTTQSFEILKLKKKDDMSCIPEAYQNEETTVFDESIYYAGQNCNSCSLCLPGDGQMHNEQGFYVKAPVMRGYEVSLLANIYAFTNYNLDKMATLQEEKSRFADAAKAIVTLDIAPKYAQIAYFSDYQYKGHSGNIGKYDHHGYRPSRHDYDFEYESPEEELEDYDEYEYEFAREQAIEDSYQMAESYAEDEFDVYYQDILLMYGLNPEEELEQTFRSIFAEVKENQQMLNEEYEDMTPEEYFEMLLYNRAFEKGYLQEEEEDCNYELD